MYGKNKEAGISMGIFSYFGWGIHLKARSSGYINTREWKLKDKLAGNTTFDGNQEEILVPFSGQK